MDVKKPIFIVGVGRSGSTVFHDMMAKHPNVTWMTRMCNKYPEKPEWNRRLVDSLDLPVLGSVVQKRLKTSEAWEFWRYHSKVVGGSCRDIFPDDVTAKVKKKTRSLMQKMLSRKRNRLLIKFTGWPRIGYFSEIFEDAKFVHVYRDGRAVSNSMVEMKWWDGWRGPDSWGWGPLNSSQQAEWEQHDKSFVALAAIQWKVLMDSYEVAKKYVSPENLYEVNYNELCEKPFEILKEVTKFCDLDWTPFFENELKAFSLKSADDKWKQSLTAKQQETLETVLHDYLVKYKFV